MTCKDFSGMIPDFFDDILDNPSLRDFLDHYRTCEECREELEIQYLVSKAFEQLEVGEEINLSRDLPAWIEEEQRRLESRVRLERTAMLLEGAALLTAVLTAAVFLLL
ncbi:MAG: zf-HC2 domain-containing protein [Eubacteriales bacterium]|nr:zf-HC2 domain-containing protein [Eubacteriales bacterium]